MPASSGRIQFLARAQTRNQLFIPGTTGADTHRIRILGLGRRKITRATKHLTALFFRRRPVKNYWGASQDVKAGHIAWFGLVTS